MQIWDDGRILSRELTIFIRWVIQIGSTGRDKSRTADPQVEKNLFGAFGRGILRLIK
jgi:hypothetical protein